MPDEATRAREGLLLTIDYRTVAGRTWLRLWVKDGPRARPLLDPDFAPYFYALPDPGTEVQTLADRLARLRVGDMHPVSVDVVRRQWGAIERAVVRIELRHPGHTPPLREAARKIAGVADVLEADIPYAYRYLVDKRLRPLDGVTFTTAPAPDGTGELALDPVARPTPVPTDLRVLAFDLEVANPQTVPRPDVDRIVAISIATSMTEPIVHVLASDDARAEADLIGRFVQTVERLDPDVILTYNGDQFDWPYLRDRAQCIGASLPVGRDASPPDFTDAGTTKIVTLAGRANVDLFKVAQRDLKERVKVMTLENVAEALGVMERDARATLPRDRILDYWQDPELRQQLIAYTRDDALSTLGIGQALLPAELEFARAIGYPLEDVARMGRGRQVDHFLLREAGARGILAPNRGGGSGEIYEGGFVLPPVEGLHENVVALDFSSMYPSIMIGYNISPETLAAPDCGDCWVAPEVNHRFLKQPEGFFTQIMRGLVARRKQLKQRARDAPSARERDRLDIEQRALKILTNAFYGYMGWPQARWYSREAAEATAAWGRNIITTVIQLAREQGIDVLYGDTDSLFVRDTPQVPGFVAQVNRSFPLELDVQDRYEVLFFTGRKKRYAGLTCEGEIVARGLEVRRGDWCALAKRLQNQVLETVLRERDPQAAARDVSQAVTALRHGEVPLRDLTLHKTLTMALRSYKARPAHVLAVERAVREHPNYKPTVGAKVAYVILKEDAREHAARHGAPTGRMGERAKLVEFLEPEDEIDLDYYVDKQIVPAALRVLEHFGVTEAQLKGGLRQPTLFEFG